MSFNDEQNRHARLVEERKSLLAEAETINTRSDVLSEEDDATFKQTMARVQKLNGEIAECERQPV